MSDLRSELPFDHEADAATGGAGTTPTGTPTPAELAAGALHAGIAPMDPMPPGVRARLEGLIEDSGSGFPFRREAGPAPRRAFRLRWFAAAAIILLTVAFGWWTVRDGARLERDLADANRRILESEARAQANARLLAEAREEGLRLGEAIAQRQAALDAKVAALDTANASGRALEERLIAQERSALEKDTEIARRASRELELASALADATARLTEAELAIARFEAPVDPALLAENRRKLAEVPGTIRLAWSPFDVPGLPPAEQPGVEGDVLWNDALQTGYLRFAGLDPNDPGIEQYQVWVIDERGMEQKVSGGVFDVSAEGEVIVPIKPGIDVGRVALFAVTVENPGGTWVPDLRRRIVVAPRG